MAYDLEEEEKGRLAPPPALQAQKRLPTVEEAFGPATKPVVKPASTRLPTAEEAFGPAPTNQPAERQIMRTIPPLSPAHEIQTPDVESPEFEKTSTLTPEEEERASSGRKVVYPMVGATVGGFIGHPVLGYAAGRQAADITEIAKGRPTDKSYTQQGLEMADVNLPQEGVGGRVVEQAIKVPEDIALGKAMEVGGRYALKGAGRGLSKIPYVRDLPFVNKLQAVETPRAPGSFKTKTERIIGKVKAPYTREAAPAAKAAEVQPPAEVKPSPSVEKSTRVKMGPRPGAETEIEGLKNIEKGLYQKAEGMTSKSPKVNFDKYNEYLNDFPKKDNAIFGRLNPTEKKEIKGVIDQIQREISPEIRGGLRGRTRIDEEQLADLIERGGFGDIGVITEPGTFPSARATRSWLSEKSYKAFTRGDKELGIAYKNLKNALEKNLEKSVGKDAWAAWKEADSFKTRRHLMDDIFGSGVERRPGQYDFKKVKKSIDKIPTERFEAAGFSKEEINAMREISDASGWRLTVENHPSLKLIIPWIAAEMIGIPVPSISPLRHAASLTHVVPGGGIGGY